MRKSFIINISYSILAFMLILASGSGLLKGIVISIFFFSMLTLVGVMVKSYEESIIYLLGFCLPLNVLLYFKIIDSTRYVAGAGLRLTISLYDLLIFMFIINCEIRKSNKLKQGTNIILPLVYIIIHIASFGFSLNYLASLFEVVRLIKCVIFSFYIIRVFSDRFYNVFVSGLGAAIKFQFIVGILQILKGGALGLYVLGESEKVFREGVLGLEKGMSGTLAHPGTLGIFSLFCLSMFIFAKNIRGRQRNIILTISTIVLTFARTSIALMCVLISLYFIIENRKVKKIRITYKHIMVSMVMIIVFLVGNYLFNDKIQVVFNRFANSDFDNQVEGRSEHSQIALEIFKEREHWAYGPNNYVFVSEKFYPIQYAQKVFNYIYPVHNLYLLYLVELGIVGVTTYVLINFSIIFNFIRRLNYQQNNSYMQMLASTSAWTIIFLAYNFTGWSGAKDYLVYIMWISVGISNSALRRISTNKSISSRLVNSEVEEKLLMLH